MRRPERTDSIKNYKCMKHFNGVTPEGKDHLGELFIKVRIKIRDARTSYDDSGQYHGTLRLQDDELKA